MSLLFSPWKIKSLALRNRLMMSPMCQYQAVEGRLVDWHFVHYGARAVGGAGLVMVEATAVSPEGRISPGDLGIWDDSFIGPFARLVDFIHSQGAAAGLQLAHAGRKASTRNARPLPPGEGGWAPVAPSAIPFDAGFPEPRELSAAEVENLLSRFEAAAHRARAAGFDLVEMHGAHGYLAHEFLSPHANRRADAWGGSFENRTRFLLEAVRRLRAVWPRDLPLFARVSATDWSEPEGWTLEDTVRLARDLKALGLDLLDCSSGGMLPRAKVPVAPGYQVPFAERVKRETGLATGAVGLITTGAQAEDILRQEQADLIVVGREFLRDPHFPLRAARELGEDILWPEPYRLAKPAPPNA